MSCSTANTIRKPWKRLESVAMPTAPKQMSCGHVMEMSPAIRPTSHEMNTSAMARWSRCQMLRFCVVDTITVSSAHSRMSYQPPPYQKPHALADASTVAAISTSGWYSALSGSLSISRMRAMASEAARYEKRERTWSPASQISSPASAMPS